MTERPLSGRAGCLLRSLDGLEGLYCQASEGTLCGHWRDWVTVVYGCSAAGLARICWAGTLRK